MKLCTECAHYILPPEPGFIPDHDRAQCGLHRRISGVDGKTKVWPSGTPQYCSVKRSLPSDDCGLLGRQWQPRPE